MNILQILFYLASLVIVNAAGTASANISIPKSGAISASGITTGVILLVLGTIFLFFGRKFIKVTVFLGGFFLVGMVFLIIIYWVIPPNKGDNIRELIYLTIGIVLGLIGGALALWLYKTNLLIIGGLGGFALATYVMGWSSTGLFTQNWAKIIFICGFVVVSALLVMFLERPAIILSTSVYGSYAVFVGIDCFAKTGFKESITNVLSKTKAPIKITPSMYGMLVGVVIFAVIGAVVQFKTTSDTKKTPQDPKQNDPKFNDVRNNDGKYTEMKSNA
ncbi:hypothetical protein BB558_003160 [Smittium angustum]|uniref:Transmembrane protein 198 n=1 Tax=Smittium angustum TaxID=133377 RepID=A0A2U1J736_SMIAN|nr:hypothetical protein BB558_003160 [Smittium angustum]